MKKIIFTLTLLLSVVIVSRAQVGRVLSPVKLDDLDNHQTALPFLGKKVFTLVYIDPDVYDVNETITKALRSKQFPKEKFGAIGVVNAVDTWIPMGVIQSKLRQSMKGRGASAIFFDKEQTLPRSWSLGKCNDAVVVLVVGKDSKVKYQKMIKTQQEGKAEIPKVLSVIEREIQN